MASEHENSILWISKTNEELQTALAAACERLKQQIERANAERDSAEDAFKALAAATAAGEDYRLEREAYRKSYEEATARAEAAEKAFVGEQEAHKVDMAHWQAINGARDIEDACLLAENQAQRERAEAAERARDVAKERVEVLYKRRHMAFEEIEVLEADRDEAVGLVERIFLKFKQNRKDVGQDWVSAPPRSWEDGWMNDADALLARLPSATEPAGYIDQWGTRHWDATGTNPSATEGS